MSDFELEFIRGEEPIKNTPTLKKCAPRMYWLLTRVLEVEEGQRELKKVCKEIRDHFTSMAMDELRGSEK